jgi:hypothetical protein
MSWTMGLKGLATAPMTRVTAEGTARTLVGFPEVTVMRLPPRAR